MKSPGSSPGPLFHLPGRGSGRLGFAGHDCLLSVFVPTGMNLGHQIVKSRIDAEAFVLSVPIRAKLLQGFHLLRSEFSVL